MKGLGPNTDAEVSILTVSQRFPPCRHIDAQEGLSVSSPQIVQELRRRLDSCHQQMIAGAGAGDVMQVPLAVVDFFEIDIALDINR